MAEEADGCSSLDVHLGGRDDGPVASPGKVRLADGLNKRCKSVSRRRHGDDVRPVLNTKCIIADMVSLVEKEVVLGSDGLEMIDCDVAEVWDQSRVCLQRHDVRAEGYLGQR